MTEWYKGTGLRPVLAALQADESAEFVAPVRRAGPGGLSGRAVRHGAAIPPSVRGRAQGVTRELAAD